MDEFKVAIIGGGPAGISAAMQLSRSDIAPVAMFEHNELGGLLHNANLVENYPGFPGGISGPDLVLKMRQQLGRHNYTRIMERVTDIDYYEDKFHVRTNESYILSDYLIVASGTVPKRYTEHDISHMKSICYYDIIALREKTGASIGIIGAGDAAFDYAINLAGRNNCCTIINRNAGYKCLPLLHKRALKIEVITYLDNTTIDDIYYDKGQAQLTCQRNGAPSLLNFDYLLFAIGRRPELSFMSLNITEQQDDLTDKHKLFLIGDLNAGIYRQTTISVADGVRAAMMIFEEDRKKK